MSHRPAEPDRHGWNRLDHYQAIHDRCMEECRGYFVEHDTLQFEVAGRDRIRLQGTVFCHGDLVIHVSKMLELNAQHEVRGLRYTYQAQFEPPPERIIFRYDNAHTYEAEGHEDAFHKHIYSVRTWKEIEPPIWVGRQGLPELSKIIDELYDWWILHRDDRLIYP